MRQRILRFCSKLFDHIVRNFFNLFFPLALLLLLLIMFDIDIKFNSNFTKGISWGYFDAFITIITYVGVIWGIQSSKRLRDSHMQRIGVFLQFRNDKKVKLKSYTIRKNFTRADLKGILRDICTGNYNINYLASEAFLADVDAVQQGQKNEITIKVDADGLTLVQPGKDKKPEFIKHDLIPVHHKDYEQFFCKESNQEIPIIEEPEPNEIAEPESDAPPTENSKTA